MIAGQRSAHKVIWLLLIITIPVLLFFAINELKFNTIEVTTESQVLEVELVDKKLNLTLNTPFKSASTVVYELNKTGKSGVPIGQLQGVGNYSFHVSNDITGIVVVDVIKERELYKIKF